MAKASSARKHHNVELSPSAVLAPLLRPGETLEIALSGAAGWFEGLSLLDLPAALLEIIGGLAGGTLNRTTSIGIAGEDLVFAITKDRDKPTRLQRAPLGSVRIVKFKESHTAWLIDVLIIDTGTRRLTLSTLPGLRPVIHELVAALDRHRQDRPAEVIPPLPLSMRLASWFHNSVIEGDIATAMREKGPARASLRASQVSLKLLGLCIVAGLLMLVGLMAVTFIFPAGLSGPFQDILRFLLLLPLFLAALLGAVAALAAGGLAVYSIFKRGEKPLTVIGALLAAGTLAFVYYLLVTILFASG